MDSFTPPTVTPVHHFKHKTRETLQVFQNLLYLIRAESETLSVSASMWIRQRQHCGASTPARVVVFPIAPMSRNSARPAFRMMSHDLT